MCAGHLRLRSFSHCRTIETVGGVFAVFPDKAGKISQRACVVLGRGWMPEVLCPQEPLDDLRVDEGCGTHGDTPLGSSKPTARRSSVASFRYSAVAAADVCPSTSPMILSGTPERSRLTARAWRKAWGPFLPWGLIPAARRRALVTQLRIDPFLNGRCGAWIRRNTSRCALEGRAFSRYRNTASPGSGSNGSSE